MKKSLIVLDEIPPSFPDLIGDGLAEFNTVSKGPSNYRDLAISVGDTDDCAGGLVGYTAWGWLFVQWLWVAEHARGQGYASGLLVRAEQVAAERGCAAAWIDTFNPDAKRLYERFGYVVFGELADFPAGHTRYFLQKRFGAIASS
ncbi:GNAT family N-acetyltransferase [Burkholderia pyrrocinia]|uniref:GNAT family N-acetyltransferase n=1 Tax=Burkholderia pyrrocinia TaxID=60550 RepID=UPI001BCB87B4|nr:GNAT family N-acetyltransferase [Burkholderia pyrrocinia]QVN22106.1 GNAT family N-acetyltransferase [Burkholderia pyrrocinia]